MGNAKFPQLGQVEARGARGFCQTPFSSPAAWLRSALYNARPQGLLLASLETRASQCHSIPPLYTLRPNIQRYPLDCPHPPTFPPSLPSFLAVPPSISFFLILSRFSHIKIHSTHVVFQRSASQETNSICWELVDGNEFIQFSSQILYLNVDR